MGNHLVKRASNAGSHFFDRATMRFFDSRLAITSIRWIDDDVAMFVTSEKCSWSLGGARKYSIRVAEFSRVTLADGSTRELAEIGTASGHVFQEFDTLDSAMGCLRKDIAKKRDRHGHILP